MLPNGIVTFEKNIERTQTDEKSPEAMNLELMTKLEPYFQMGRKRFLASYSNSDDWEDVV